MNGIRGYIDLQVNGYAGVDFNSDDLTPEGLHRACQALERDGTAAILATIVTDEMPRMEQRLRSLVRWRGVDPLATRLIGGIHIEGPFLNEHPGYAGAHPAAAMQPATRDAMNRLLDAAGGLTRLVTLAPERDTDYRVTSYLADQQIIVAAGHTDATLDQLRAAHEHGLTMFTHLGNGCPVILPRHDNIIQRVLSLASRFWISFIADGVHIPVHALGNYLRLTDPAKTIVVSDAISAASLGPGQYTLAGRTVEVGADLAVRAQGSANLMGAAATLNYARQLLTDQLGYHESDTTRLLIDNPGRLLSLSDRDPST